MEKTNMTMKNIKRSPELCNFIDIYYRHSNKNGVGIIACNGICLLCIVRTLYTFPFFSIEPIVEFEY